MLSNKKLVILLQSILIIISGCAATTGPEDAARNAFDQWAKVNRIPYQQDQLEILSDDGAFAQVLIVAQIRSSVESDWVEQEFVIEMRYIGDEWIADFQEISLPVPTSVPWDSIAHSYSLYLSRPSLNDRTIFDMNDHITGFIERYGVNWAFIPNDLEEFRRRKYPERVDQMTEDEKEYFAQARIDLIYEQERQLEISFEPGTDGFVGFTYDQLAEDPKLIAPFLEAVRSKHLDDYQQSKRADEGPVSEDLIIFYRQQWETQEDGG